jgi:hypothetical protein
MKNSSPGFYQGRTGHCGNAAITAGLFLLRMQGFLFILRGISMIFSENFKTVLKISDLFEDIFREIEAFLINVRVFQRLQGFLKIFLVELRFFQSDVRLILSEVRLIKKSEVF